MKKFNTLILLALLTFGLVGCKTTEAVTRDVAEKTALTEVDGKVANYEERFDDDEPHHLFDIVKDDQHYEVKIHRDTGEVISNKLVDDNEGIQRTTNDSSNATDSFITEEEAKKIALDKVGGGSVVKTKLTTDDGEKVYKIEIHHNNKEYDIEIDAVSKEIIEYEEDIID